MLEAFKDELHEIATVVGYFPGASQQVAAQQLVAQLIAEYAEGRHGEKPIFATPSKVESR